jgi:hypothetical protein
VHARRSQEIAIPNLRRGAKKVGTTLESLQWKTKNGVSMGVTDYRKEDAFEGK